MEPQQLFPVFVTVRAEGSEGSANIVELIAENGDIEENKVYLYIGKQVRLTVFVNLNITQKISIIMQLFSCV